MRFPKALYIFALIPLALALLCSETPESRALTDDVSNDLVVRSPAHATAVVEAITDNSGSNSPFPASEELTTSDRGTLFSNPATRFLTEDILHLLSIQRE